MFEIILGILMITSGGAVGYSIRALQHPVQKRAKNGRFTKK